MAHHIFVQGPLGGGKTFIMSVLAHHWKQKSLRARGRYKIIFKLWFVGFLSYVSLYRLV